MGIMCKLKEKNAIVVDTMAGMKIIRNVMYLHQLNQNLVSVGQLLEIGHSLSFKKGLCSIKDDKGVLLLSTRMMNKSFNIDWNKSYLNANICREEESVLWHKRLGHFNYAALRKMSNL